VAGVACDRYHSPATMLWRGLLVDVVFLGCLFLTAWYTSEIDIKKTFYVDAKARVVLPVLADAMDDIFYIFDLDYGLETTVAPALNCMLAIELALCTIKQVSIMVFISVIYYSIQKFYPTSR